MAPRFNSRHASALGGQTNDKKVAFLMLPCIKANIEGSGEMPCRLLVKNLRAT